MKRVLLLSGMLIALSVPSQAFSSEYRRLTDGCRHYELEGHVDAYAECVAYILAVTDVLAYWARYNVRACIPSHSVASGQLAAVIKRSLDGHPEVAPESTSALVAAALSNAFACKQ